MKIIYLSALFLMSAQLKAQTVAELKEKITKLEGENHNLEKEKQSLGDSLLLKNNQLFNVRRDSTVLKNQNDYFRNTLQLFEKKIAVKTRNNVDYTILSCKGNAEEQTVTFKLMINNHGPNSKEQLTLETYVIDLQGNKNAEYPKLSEYNKIITNTDVPVQVDITFKGILPSVQMFKELSLSLFEQKNPGFKYTVTFKDLSIDWL